MALDPRLALGVQPVNLVQSLQGGINAAETLRTQNLRDAILGNQQAQGQQNLVTGLQQQALNKQSQALNQQALQAGEFNAGQLQVQADQQKAQAWNALFQDLKEIPTMAGRAEALAKASVFAPQYGIDEETVKQIPLDDAGLDQGIAATGGFIQEQQDLVKQQFGASNLVKDEKGNLYNVTPKNNPQTGEQELIVSPLPEGLSIASKTTGLTADEKVENTIKQTQAVEDIKTESQITRTEQTEIAKDVVDRGTARINIGLDAAKGIPTLRRLGVLLDRVDTGGVDSISIRTKAALGAENADEGELTNKLGKAVLTQLKATFGSQFTQEEGDRLTRIEAGLSKNTKTNKRLVNELLQFAQKKADLGIKTAREQGDEQTAQEIEQIMSFEFDENDLSLFGKDVVNPPAINHKGWRLMEDANGNKAYVSPDGQVEEL